MALYKIEKDAQGQPTGDLDLVAGGTNFADNPIGSILPFGSDKIPSGYLLCNGTAVSRTTYSELFAVIGESFGAGDGSTTFNLPDMRESVPKGAGLQGLNTVGAHLDADGLAVGEFLDDRLQTHVHKDFEWSNGTAAGTNATLMWNNGIAATSNNKTFGVEDARSGNTTEVKSVGVNYIIKAKMIAIPSDFLSAVDETVEESMAGGIKDIKIKNVNIPTQAFTNGMNLATNVDSELDSGYEFVAFTSYASVGWTTTSPLYFANPNVKAGIPCISDPSIIPTQSGLSFAFFFLEIKRY